MCLITLTIRAQARVQQDYCIRSSLLSLDANIPVRLVQRLDRGVGVMMVGDKLLLRRYGLLLLQFLLFKHCYGHKSAFKLGSS